MSGNKISTSDEIKLLVASQLRSEHILKQILNALVGSSARSSRSKKMDVMSKVDGALFTLCL